MPIESPIYLSSFPMVAIPALYVEGKPYIYEAAIAEEYPKWLGSASTPITISANSNSAMFFKSSTLMKLI